MVVREGFLFLKNLRHARTKHKRTLERLECSKGNGLTCMCIGIWVESQVRHPPVR